MITVQLTSDCGWVPGKRAPIDKERFFILVTRPGCVGVAVAYGSFAEYARLQGIYNTLKAILERGR